MTAIAIRRAYFHYPSEPAHKLLTDNLPRYWWQSRHNLPDPPKLTDLRELARDVRRGWPWR